MSKRKNKFERTRIWLLQIAEDSADYARATEILNRNEPTYTLDEVIQRTGMDKYHLKFRTKRLQKKHRLEWHATQK